MLPSPNRSPLPPRAAWRPLGRYRGPISNSGVSAVARASSNPTIPKQPLTPSPTRPEAQPARKRGLSNLFSEDDGPEPLDVWGHESHKKQRLGRAISANADGVDGGEDLDDNGTVCGEEGDVVLNRSNRVSDSAGEKCGAAWPDICDRPECLKCCGEDDMDMGSENGDERGGTVRSTAAYKSRKSAQGPARKGNAEGGPSGEKGSRNANGGADESLKARKEIHERSTKQFVTHYRELKKILGEVRGRLAPGYVGPVFKVPELDDKMADAEIHAEGMNRRHEDSIATKKAKPKQPKIDLPRTVGELRKMVERGSAERQRQWMSTVTITHLKAKCEANSMYRIWDSASQGRIRDPDMGMEAAGGANLNTPEQRRHWLKNHLNWGYRGRGTPFTSWSHDLYYLHTTPQRIPHIFKRATGKNPADAAWLTQMNINARLEGGRPIINALDERNYYLPKDLSDGSMYEKEWLLLYQVYPKEIVWNWNWRHIEQWMLEHDCFDIIEWEEAIANPAYEVHEAARWEGKSAKARRRAVNEFLQGTDMFYAALIEGQV